MKIVSPRRTKGILLHYRAAGKVWLDTVVQEKERAYDTLYDRLQQLGTEHKEGLDQASPIQWSIPLRPNLINILMVFKP